MSICFMSDNELEYFDRGFQAGAYAAMETVVRRHPELEEEFYEIVEEILKITNRDDEFEPSEIHQMINVGLEEGIWAFENGEDDDDSEI